MHHLIGPHTFVCYSFLFLCHISAITFWLSLDLPYSSYTHHQQLFKGETLTLDYFIKCMYRYFTVKENIHKHVCKYFLSLSSLYKSMSSLVIRWCYNLINHFLAITNNLYWCCEPDACFEAYLCTVNSTQQWICDCFGQEIINFIIAHITLQPLSIWTQLYA